VPKNLSAYTSEEGPSLILNADLDINPVSSTAVSASNPAAAPSSVLSSEPRTQTSSDLQVGPTPDILGPVEAGHSPSESPTARTPVDDTSSTSPGSPSLSPPLQGKKGEQRIVCDFSSLVPGDFVTSGLRQTCFLEITAFSLDGSHGGEYSTGGPARVFDSSNPTEGSNQLGSPNHDCPKNAGPGQGSGGSPLHQANQAYQNCEARGNVLIVPERSQKEDENDPIPAAMGGCINFHFVVPVLLQGAGVLDIPPRTTVMYTVRDSSMESIAFV
jgi:hypothetical protein